MDVDTGKRKGVERDTTCIGFFFLSLFLLSLSCHNIYHNDPYNSLCILSLLFILQGPYSEFRMNLNTSNPLLLAAITGGGGANATLAGSDTPLDMTMGPAGLFFRARNNNNNGGAGAGDDMEDMFGGGDPFNPMRNGAGRGTNPNNAFHHMGPVPSAGTDKDFVWGFILGFFVGFIMLFWVWMPTVPHKQKIGIISGISFQLGLNLLRKSSQEGQMSGGGGDGGDGSVPAFCVAGVPEASRSISCGVPSIL